MAGRQALHHQVQEGTAFLSNATQSSTAWAFMVARESPQLLQVQMKLIYCGNYFHFASPVHK